MQSLISGFVEIDDTPFRERFLEEISKFKHSPKEWAAYTNIPKNTIDNILNTGRKATLRAEYIWAFWSKYPSIDVHYIITGQREDVFRKALEEIRDRANDTLGNP